MKTYYLVTSLPKGSPFRDNHIRDFKTAHQLLSLSLNTWSPLVKGIVIQLVELDDGKKTLIEMAARDEVGILRMEQMREIVA